MRYGIALALVTIGAALFAFADVAFAMDKRFALLIGNQAYDKSVGVLKNPHNDIEIVAKALTGQGFEILPPVKDARRSAILGAVRDLAGRLRAAGPGSVGFLYYSGHGAAEKDTNINYLIPVDAKDPGSVAFWDDSVKLDDVMRLLDQARESVKFVVFDACRNELQLPTRDTSKGLVPVAEQQGFFVAYASAPGRTATDRGEKSGPYAAALAKEFGRQGLDHLNLFQNVKETVIASTGGSQHPWESNGLTRRVYLTGEPTTPADIALWESVRTTGDQASLQRYLDRFPNGVFAATAVHMMERLKAEDAQREAARQFEIERKTQEAKQAAELQKALDEARAARAALASAERQRAAAENAVTASKKSVDAAIAERDAAALRETELRQTQRALEAGGSQSAAAAEVARKLKAAAEEVRVSREALAAAEAKRAAAEQAATEAKKLADKATAEQGAAKLAMLNPQTVPPDAGAAKLAGPFGGYWALYYVSENCMVKTATHYLTIDGGAVSVTPSGAKGNVAGDGSFKYTHAAKSDGKPVIFTGKLSGDAGTGTFTRVDRRCGGHFTVKRK
jgi:hypothetical protein